MFGEITRVLKNKGEIHIIIPFLYPIHGSPNDYIRVTSDYIENYLDKKYLFLPTVIQYLVINIDTTRVISPKKV